MKIDCKAGGTEVTEFTATEGRWEGQTGQMSAGDDTNLWDSPLGWTIIDVLLSSKVLEGLERSRIAQT